YWDSFLVKKRGPELIRQLNNANYKIGIFASAQLNFPAFDQTIFSDVKPLMIHTPGETTIARDRAITNEFEKFILSRNTKQPFFSFLFYDAVHNYCEPTTPLEHPFKPWKRHCSRFTLTTHSNRIPYVNRYLNAVYFVDNEVKKVLQTLEQQHLLKNTVI